MSNIDIPQEKEKKAQKEWVPNPETLDDAKLLEKAGFLNLVAPFGIGVFRLGKTLNNSELKKRGIYQMASSILLIGIAWSVADGIHMRKIGKEQAEHLGGDVANERQKEGENITVTKEERREQKKKDTEEKRMKKEAEKMQKKHEKEERRGKKDTQDEDKKEKKKSQNEEIEIIAGDQQKIENGPKIQVLAATPAPATGAQTPAYDSNTMIGSEEASKMTVHREPDLLPETISNHVECSFEYGHEIDDFDA